MRVEGLTANRTAHLSIMLEVSCRYLYFLFVLQSWLFQFASSIHKCLKMIWQIFEVAPTFYMVEMQKAAGDASEYLKVL